MEWDNNPIPNLYHIIGILEGINAYLRSSSLTMCVEYLRLLIAYFEKNPPHEF